MPGELSLWRRLGTILLLPGIVLRNMATVTALAFAAESDDIESLEDVLRENPFVLRARSVVDWERLDADWPLAPTAQTLIPLVVLAAGYPYHVQLSYPLLHPGAVSPAVLWIPIAYVTVNVAYAVVADVVVIYLDAFAEARYRISRWGDAS